MSNSKKTAYYSKRILFFVVSVIVLSLAVFVISRLTPADPLQSYYGDRTEKMSTEEKETARDRLGLNEPILVQYVKWVQSAFQGNFGISYKYKQDVLEVIENRIGNTLLLGGLGFVIIFVGSLLLGILCAWNEDRLADKFLCKIGTFLSCIPEFWMCLILILVFSVTLRIFPSGGAYTVGRERELSDRLWHLALPLFVVVVGHLWYYAYLVRNKLLEEIREDYVLLARIKGLSKKQIMMRHCLRNVMPSYISIMAISVPHILGGTYIVEVVFSYPGIGTLSYESARYADYNMLMVLCLLTGIVVIFFNVIGQIINERIDPRMREAKNHPDEEVETGNDKTNPDEETETGNDKTNPDEETETGNDKTNPDEEAETCSDKIILIEKDTTAAEKNENANFSFENNHCSLDKDSKATILQNNGLQISAEILNGSYTPDKNDDECFVIIGSGKGNLKKPEQIKKHKNTPVVSMVILGILLITCLLAESFINKDPFYLDLLNYNVAPNKEFIFGTDTLGRDIFSCILYGGRISLFIGLLSTVISTFIAILFGTLSGLSPKWLDSLMMRFTEIVLSIPGLLLIIFIQAIFGKPSVITLSIVVGLTSWTSIAKVVRTEVIQLKNSDYIIASKCMGGGFFHVLTKHLTPNFIASIMFMIVMNIRGAIVSESTLSFMGIGLPVEIISLGSMLSLAEKALLTKSWWIIVIPGAFLIIFLICITNIGNWLRGSMNHKESKL